MNHTLTKRAYRRFFGSNHKVDLSLSTYFPSGTQYFYAYPAGMTKGFVNYVPPVVEELVSARALSCSGLHVSTVCFQAVTERSIDRSLLLKLGLLHEDDLKIILTKRIDTDLTSVDRNEAVIQALLKTTDPGKLVMAQPYDDARLDSRYAIPSSLISWLNDKNNMPEYIDSAYLPERLASYPNGKNCAKQIKDLPLPFALKITSSSAGDGVHLCRTPADVRESIEKIKDVPSNIIVEKLIATKKNYGVHFGIPYDKKKSIDILGVNEQVTSEEGEFLGGIISSQYVPDDILKTIEYIKGSVLPRVRKMGWFGVGGFDVLLDNDDQPYIIDCNFRMTGVTAYHFLVRNSTVDAPLITFTGSFTGDQRAFEDLILPLAASYAKEKKLHIIALNHHDGAWNFNAALLLSKGSSPESQIKSIIDLGIAAPALLKHLQS